MGFNIYYFTNVGAKTSPIIPLFISLALNDIDYFAS